MPIGIPNSDAPHEVAGGDELLERLESARLRVAESLALPGIEGQAALFARLEDLREALEGLGRRAAAGERDRAGAVLILDNCRRTLGQLRSAIEFLRGMVEERASRSAGAVYAAEAARSRPLVAAADARGAWEG